ncbi:hypothetical protein FRB99_008260 [Tulasnella sp. 403]|nr:hypothetical protein FRB99_008260 [Tulasnella sp. 403]
MSAWQPKRTLQECYDIMTKTPGSPFETELAYVDGRILRVYKNLPPSLRHFWLDAVGAWQDREYLYFEGERITYRQMHEWATRAASVFRTKYQVRKGDRVGIVSRNYPEWVTAFWACQLLGAINVAVNAWLPATGKPSPLKHCISHTECKLLIVDPERVNALLPWLSETLSDSNSLLKAVLVIRDRDTPVKTAAWKFVQRWDEVVFGYTGRPDEWQKEPECTPEDPCSIFFTSGTTGLPKGVLNSHRGFLTNLPNMMANWVRHTLRNGEDLQPRDRSLPQQSSIVGSPFFHVMGTTTYLIVISAMGGRLVMLRKWDRNFVVRLIRKEGAHSLTGVPFMLQDLVDSELSQEERNRITSLSFGGAPAPESVVNEYRARFPNATLTQGYGLTETNAGVAMNAGDDFLARPSSTGLPTPINDILIVDEATMKVQPHGEVGEIWVRGPNVMKEYWKDPVATDKAITKDGWFRTGDIGCVDEDGFLYIKDRSKDIIIRGGENIDSVAVENAIYHHPRILDCAAVGVPDRKLGELVAVAVVAKTGHKGHLKENEVIQEARQHLPSFAVPVMVVEMDTIPRNATGKIVKREIRGILKREWLKRLKTSKTKAKM